jgi:hypothetical protein
MCVNDTMNRISICGTSIQVILNDLNESLIAVDDAHKARNIGNMAEGNGFPRVDSLVRIEALALRGTSRVEHLIE